MRLIDAESVINDLVLCKKIINDAVKDSGNLKSINQCTQTTLDGVIKIISLYPTAERKKGRWIHSKETITNVCSECRCCAFGWWQYCPMCGAKMEGGESE